MIYPSAKLEKELLISGYQNIAGLDEAGRGCWAGPVVAGAIIFDPLLQKIKGINDSKLVTPSCREKIYDQLIANFDYGAGVVSSRLIDELNIIGATKLAMEQAIENLKSPVQYLLIDALTLQNLKQIKQQGIIKGDQKILVIAAASIIAKVIRDRLMAGYYHQNHAVYGFDRHKGYGTAVHQQTLKQHGPCAVHRMSFQPLKGL